MARHDLRTQGMKINIEVECTPEEARTFLGLPDVTPLQSKLMSEIESRMRQAIAAADPSAFVEGWMPLSRNVQSLWGQVMQAAAQGLKSAAEQSRERREAETKAKGADRSGPKPGAEGPKRSAAERSKGQRRGRRSNAP